MPTCHCCCCWSLLRPVFVLFLKKERQAPEDTPTPQRRRATIVFACLQAPDGTYPSSPKNCSVFCVVVLFFKQQQTPNGPSQKPVKSLNCVPFWSFFFVTSRTTNNNSKVVILVSLFAVCFNSLLRKKLTNSFRCPSNHVVVVDPFWALGLLQFQ